MRHKIWKKTSYLYLIVATVMSSSIASLKELKNLTSDTTSRDVASETFNLTLSSQQRAGNLGQQQHQQQQPQVSSHADQQQHLIDSYGNREALVDGGKLKAGAEYRSTDCAQAKQAAQSTKSLDCNEAKTIETAVFVDAALDSKFTGLSGGLVDLNKLIMTIMNQVQHLFKYSSIRVPINIRLVLVEHMSLAKENGGPPLPDAENGDIDLYLSNFCNWQQARLEREKRLWWDHAILLSGLDLYKSTGAKNHTGVLGLAWVGGMCKGNYSCTINEASNLESAFVIAHEIGHSLGIMHDGQRNNCDPNGFIMSERTGAGKIHWSRCSNNYLNESINRRQLSCLENDRSSASDTLYDLSKLKAPGQVYAINEQCKLAFGNNYTAYVTNQKPFNSVCRELWCVAGTWAKAAHPALEGSVCSSGGADRSQVCREGKCITI